MRFVLFVIILLVANIAYAQQSVQPGGAAVPAEGPVSFVYDDHNQRDPLTPLVSLAGVVMAYDADMTMSDFVLEGIVADAKGANVAIINGKVVKIQDHVGPYVVEVINNDHVELVKGTERFMLKLKKGGM